MRIKNQPIHQAVILSILVILLASCTSPNATGNNEAAATPQGAQPTATPIPHPLSICLGEAPNTLYPYGNPNQAARLILQAIYDGPIDHRDYDYQSVILNETPSLANGNALIQMVGVTQGQTVLDNNGEIVGLELGTFVRPTGCFNYDCAVPYDGNPLVMDQMVTLFNIRSGITWADGTPLTAADSVFGFSLDASNPSPSSKPLLDRTQSYEVVGDNQTLWTGIPGYIDPTYTDNFWLPAPQHLWGSLSAQELLTAEMSAQKPLGYGPFSVVSWVGNEITLQGNPHYFRANENLPLVGPLIFKVVGNEADANLQRLLSGECDILDSRAAAGLDRAELQTLQSEGKLALSWANGNAWELINFGLQHQSYDDGFSLWASDRPDFFGEVRTRQAIAMCIDRQRIADEATQGLSPVMNTYIPPDHGLSSPNATTYTYDPAAAGNLLDQAGWLMGTDGVRVATGIPNVAFEGTRFSINYFHLDHPFNQGIAQIVKENLAQCGIEVTLSALPAEELYATGSEAKVFGRQFDLAQFSWQAAEEPPCYLFLGDAVPGEDLDEHVYKWGGWNLTGWSNPDFDTACKATHGTAPGLENYVLNHQTAQDIFASELPAIPLFTNQDIVVARPDICGLDFDPTAGFLWNAENLGYGVLCN
jgi:peptide/nickel transport system substrate-binding protein